MNEAKTTKSKKHKPVHPGEVLRHDFLELLGISAYRLAKELGISQQQIGRLLMGTRGITAESALRLARFFGTPATLWMNLQSTYDLEVAKAKHGKEIERRVKPYKAA